MKVSFLLLSFLSFFLGIWAQGDVSEEAQRLALKWAPLIWLHPEEKFFPVSPEFVIENVEVYFLSIQVFAHLHFPFTNVVSEFCCIVVSCRFSQFFGLRNSPKIDPHLWTVFGS